MSTSPYKLFDYYTDEDRKLFFGREEESLRMVGEILSTRLLVLFAPSGSGKSSLINAGVRPLLKERGFDSIYVRMETDPATSIRQALGAGLPTPPEPPTEGLPESGRPTVEEVARSETGHSASPETAPNGRPEPATQPEAPSLHEFLRQALQRNDENEPLRPLVIFLDQFEEFFTVYRDQPQIRQDFIRELAAIRYDTALPVFFVLSLRDDYFVNLNEFREAIPSIFQNNANIQLRPLDDAAAERAIVNPARDLHCEFDEGLCQRIIDDLKRLNPDRNGVQPITLQIVCHNLWLAKGSDENRIVAAQYDQLGGARKIIDQQLERSLAQIPRWYGRLMRRLFRVLTTRDLTKRLRSVDGLAELLRVGPSKDCLLSGSVAGQFPTLARVKALVRRINKGRLETLLGKLTDAGILRTESRRGTAWYEFRHDYLVGQVASWVNGVERRLARRRWITSLILAAAVPALIWFAKATFDFSTYVVSFCPHSAYAEQQEELWITRRFNPFGYRVTTGLLKDDLRDFASESRIREGVVLPLCRPTAWETLAHLLRDDKSATFEENHKFDALQRESRFYIKSAWLAIHAQEDPTAETMLIDGLKDEKRDIQVRAAWVLGQFERAKPKVVAALVDALEEDDWLVRIRAAEALTQLGVRERAVVAVVLEASRYSDPAVRRRAVIALGELARFDPSVAMHLVATLKDVDTEVRLRAVVALGELASFDPSVVTHLVATLEDVAPEVRLRAASVLGQLGSPEPSVVVALVEGLKDDDPFVRGGVAAALGQLGCPEPSVVTALVKTSSDNDAKVRIHAVWALVQLASTASAVATAISVPMTANKDAVWSSAADALARHRDEPGRPPLIVTALKDDNASIRLLAATVLVRSERAEPMTVTALVKALKDNEPKVRSSVAEALGRVGQKRSDWKDEKMLERLGDNDSGQRELAGIVLAYREELSPEVVVQIQKLRKDDRPWVRMAALYALVRIEEVRFEREQQTRAKTAPIQPAAP